MKTAIKLLFATVSIALITACGGGADSGPSVFGSLASRVGGLEVGVSVGQATQAAADALALNKCGNNCVVKVNFTNGQCVSSAYSTGNGGLMAWAVGSTQSEAANNAMLACVSGGGTFCSNYRGGCN